MADSQQNNTSFLQRWLEQVWYESGWQRIVSLPILLPLSALYCVINALQRKRDGVSRDEFPQYPFPIVVVGNISVGGTGKTPLTIYIVERLKHEGYKPAIITRGYGGEATSWPQSVTANSDPNLVGDEAVLMASRTQIPVIAGADRIASIELLKKEYECNVLVADDGLQHYKLPRDLQIAVIDGERMLGNGLCLPAGPLREPKSRLDYCDFIVKNGGDKNDGIKNNVNQSITMSLAGEFLLNLHSKEQRAITGFENKTVHALTGIGNPSRFYQSLEKAGLTLIKHSFPDHHAYTAKDLQFEDDYPVLMTEKDAVKCHRLISEDDKYWMLPVQARLSPEFDEQLLEKLQKTPPHF